MNTWIEELFNSLLTLFWREVLFFSVWDFLSVFSFSAFLCVYVVLGSSYWLILMKLRSKLDYHKYKVRHFLIVKIPFGRARISFNDYILISIYQEVFGRFFKISQTGASYYYRDKMSILEELKTSPRKRLKSSLSLGVLVIILKNV